MSSQSEPNTAERELKARVVAPSEHVVGPLYPTTRVLLPSIAEIEELNRRALRELREAAHRAEEIREEARQAAAAIVAEAEAGMADTIAEAAQAAGAAAAARLEVLLSQLDEQRQQHSSDCEREIIETSLAMCRAVLGVKITIEPELMATLLRETLESAGLDREITVSLHPADAELLADSLNEILESKGRAPESRIILDDRQPRGNLRIETERGIHDGSLSVRLARLERHVRARMNGEMR